MPNTATQAGRDKRLKELVDGYAETGNKTAIVRLCGGSVEDLTDHTNGYDDGEQRGADNFQ